MGRAAGPEQGLLGGGAWREGLWQSPPHLDWCSRPTWGPAEPGGWGSVPDGGCAHLREAGHPPGPAEAVEQREGSGPEKVRGKSPETCRGQELERKGRCASHEEKKACRVTGSNGDPGIWSLMLAGVATLALTSEICRPQGMVPFKRSTKLALQHAPHLVQGYIQQASPPAS